MTTANGTTNKPRSSPPGYTNAIVAANVTRLRKEQRLSAAELARRLCHHEGRPMAQLSLARLEAGTRRIDVDDLTALATALDVSPIYLLMPDTGRDKDAKVMVTTASGWAIVRAHRLWGWLTAQRPLTGDSPGFFWRGNTGPEWLWPEEDDDDPDSAQGPGTLPPTL